MKRRFLTLILPIIALTIFSGCETDIDVTAEWKDITIAYGLISQNDTVHYIKVNKAFLGEGNAYNYAQIADSSSYGDNISVTIIEKSNNGSTRTFNCDTTSVFNKEPGVFYYPRQIVYKTAFRIPADVNSKEYTYNLEIRNKITGKVITSQTPLVKDFTIETPRPGQSSIDFISENNQKIKWNSAKDGRRYNVSIRFWFDEVFNLYDTTQRYIDWNFSSVKSATVQGNESMEILYAPLSFYSICSNLIPYSDDRENSVTSRLVDRAEFRFAVAGDELNTYMEVNEPSTDIVQEKPEYTNINNGIGLFSCRYTKTASVPIGTRTEDKLIEEDIKFVNKIGNK
ncbi:MAG: hypothetical protein AB9834_11315 [Lentimicrobium sp.]